MIVRTRDIMTGEVKGYDNCLQIFEHFHLNEGLDSSCKFSRDRNRTNIEDIGKQISVQCKQEMSSK